MEGKGDHSALNKKGQEMQSKHLSKQKEREREKWKTKKTFKEAGAEK